MAYPQDESSPNTACTTFLTRGQTIGLVLTAESGVISAGAVLVLFYMIIRNILRHIRYAPENGWRFFRSPFDVYMLSLFISDLIQGIGIAFNLRWVAQGTVKCGSYCTAQGVVGQLGETTVAMATLAIACHTFVTIFFRTRSTGIVIPSLIVCAIWLYVILFVAIGVAIHTKGDEHFEAPTPFCKSYTTSCRSFILMLLAGCWVGTKFTAERVAGEYFWLWFTALASIILYLLVFYCLRGNISQGKRWWAPISFHSRAQDTTSTSPKTTSEIISNEIPDEHLPQASSDAAQQAFNMLLYPICYVGLILPLSIVRWADFVLEAHHPTRPNNITSNMPSAATFVVMSIFGLSGLVNVLLILRTRPGLLLLSEPLPCPPPRPFFASSENVTSNPRVKEHAMGT